jgi:hypothetical protein
MMSDDEIPAAADELPNDGQEAAGSIAAEGVGATSPRLPIPEGPGARGPVLGYLDSILRHREAHFGDIFANRDVLRQIGLLLGIIFVLSAVHGLSMGLSSGPLQMLASAIKVPVLYLVTLAVCFPMLYVVNVIMGSRLDFLQTLALILLAMALSAILLAACSPIAVFFAVTGSNYHFLKLLNVAIFAFSGAWGMLGLWRGLHAMCATSDLYPRQAVRILQVWIVIFAFVGTQMAWSLRPFIGTPDMGFQIFREQESNFYQGVWSSIAGLSTGTGVVVRGER